MERVIFGLVDYAVFIISLLMSIAIGVYFAFFGRKKQTEDEYLYGSKKMKAIPVGLSLYSSAISAISIIGIPAEVYSYGTGYITGVLGIILGMFIIWIVFLPVFCGNLNIKTPYEYFERRFDNNVKLLSSVIYIIHTLLMMPVVLYAPSLAVEQATNIHVLICTTLIGGICILYTTFGGFKTVIWTDSLQATLMLFSCLLVAISGINKAGGFSEVWKIASENERINFLKGTIVGLIGTSLIHIIGGVTGLAIFAIYNGCDPLKTKSVKGLDKLVPHFVTQTLDYMPGFSGFFIAGLLSAALSSLSSELNVVGGIIYYDFLMKFCRNKFIESRGTLIMKLIVIINGLIYLLCVPVLQYSKHIYELAVIMGSVTYGAKLGMLFLGILFPKTNSKGVISGALISILIVGWINFSALYYGVSSHYRLPTSIENCKEINNLTTSTFTTIPETTIFISKTSTFTSDSATFINESTTFISSTTENISKKPGLEDIFILFRISYLYYCLLGTIITIVVGNIVSYLTKPNKLTDVDPLLVAPFLRSYIRSQQKAETEMYPQEQE